MRRIYLQSGIFWCLIFHFSCASNSSEGPTVHFINPAVNSVYDLKTDLDVEIDIHDDIMIKEYKFWLENDSGWEYFSEKKDVNKVNHKVLYKFDLSDNIENEFSIHIEVNDHDGNTTYKELQVLIE